MQRIWGGVQEAVLRGRNVEALFPWLAIRTREKKVSLALRLSHCGGPRSLHHGVWRVTVLSHRPQCHSRGTSGRVPRVPAGTVWRRSSFLVVKSLLAKDLFSFGERGREGAKDVLIKYPALRVAEVSKQTLKLAWIDFSPLFTSSQKYLPFPGHVCFGFVSERRLCFCLGLALPGAPMVPPPRLGHHWLRQLGGREGREALSPLSILSAGVLMCARLRAGAQAHARVSTTHALIPPPAPANFPASIPISHTHRHSHVLVLHLQPCLPELSTLVSGPWRNPLFRLKPNLTISSFPFCWLLSHLTGHTQSIFVRLRSDFPILGSSFLKVDGGPQTVSSTPQPGFGLFFPTSPSQHTPSRSHS